MENHLKQFHKLSGDTYKRKLREAKPVETLSTRNTVEESEQDPAAAVAQESVVTGVVEPMCCDSVFAESESPNNIDVGV